MRKSMFVLMPAALSLWALSVSAEAPEASTSDEPMPVSALDEQEPVSAPQEKEQTMVIMKTSMGDITIELFDKDAPISVKNFLAYVDAGHYNGTIFHRVIGNFMVQGGGFTKDFVQKPTQRPIKNEAGNGLKNTRGTLAMARTGVIDSATSQFFINVVDNGFLDHRGEGANEFGYCVFGRVAEGMDVVDQIRKVKSGRHGPHGDVPEQAVEIIEASRAK